jgi:hypothetical protein
MSSKLLLCPHCFNENQHSLRFDHNFVPTSYDDDGKQIQTPFVATYQVFVCSTCRDLSLYYLDEGDEFPRLLYPTTHLFDPCVPVSIRKNYREAKLVQDRSPNAFVVMIRRSLEALCDDRGVAQGTLRERFKSLADKQIIPPVLAEMGAALRLLGNVGAHRPSPTWVGSASGLWVS